jgi:MotA/TolQ/ExbB proton channel family
MPQYSAQTLQAVARVSSCSSSVVHEEMKQGLYGLATIACLAPWVGLFGNVLGIVNSFQGIAGQKDAVRRAILWNISQSMWPTAFGLAVGVVALWCFRYLDGRLQILDHEMENASLELLNQLGRFRGRFLTEPQVGRPRGAPMFGEKSPAELSRDEKFRRRSMFLAGTALVMAWYVQTLRLPVETAFLYLPLTFGISCLFVYPVWTKLLHRRSGGLAALGAAICFCWTLAELASGVSFP